MVFSFHEKSGQGMMEGTVPPSSFCPNKGLDSFHTLGDNPGVTAFI